MKTDEVVLLKCYDSATDGGARFAPHGSFRDPTALEDAPLRESIELRATVSHGVRRGPNACRLKRIANRSASNAHRRE